MARLSIAISRLRWGGRFAAWCEQAPSKIEVAGREVPFTFDPASHRLDVGVPSEGACRLRIFQTRGTN